PAARVWSNPAAAGGHDPCPDYAGGRGREAYFNAAPDIFGGTSVFAGFVVKGIILPPTGGSITIPVRLFSDGSMGDWTLSAAERLDLDGEPAPVLSFSFDDARGGNGDVRRLTITRAPGPDGGASFV